MHVPIFDLSVKDPELKHDLNTAFNKVISHGKLFMGPELEEFEKLISDDTKTKYALGVSSGSSALYMALKSSGIGPGDEVITTPLTWIITVNAITSCGATPVFADVLDDYNIDPHSVEQRITSKTKAIVPMHYAGHMCDMVQLTKIASKYKLNIFEDAAQAYGASLNGKKAGSFSIVGSLSMNPMKVLGGYGEAGAVTTNDYNIFKRLKRLRHAGTTSDPKKIITNECLEISLNHKMDTINAALLIIALKHFSKKKNRREEIAKILDDNLSSFCKTQPKHENEIHGRYVYPINVENRDNFANYLKENNIETKIFNRPLACDAPIYKKYKKHPVLKSERLLSTNIIIPSHEKLSQDQIDYMINIINKFKI